MTMQYGNFAYFLPIVLIVGATVGSYFLLRRCTPRMQRGAIMAIILFNFLQHLFKRILYPHYWHGAYELRMSTAYNMCASLILAAPFITLGKSALWKDFYALISTTAGVVTMFVPYWYIGQPLLQWDVFRYYLCHGLLFMSGILPLFLRLHSLNYRNFWKIPFLFFFMIILITFNDIAVWALTGAEGDLWQMLQAWNPCWAFHPNEQFAFLIPVIDFFTPDFLMGNWATGKPFTPLLWYAIPLYILIAGLSLPIMIASNRKAFMADLAKLRPAWARHRARHARIK